MSVAETGLLAGRFAVTGPAIRGGLADVFRATDGVTGELCALKVLREGGPLGERRLEREGELLAKLHHEGLPRWIWHGRDERGRACLAVEWIEGPSLFDRLAGSPMSVEETVALGARLAHVLAFLHGEGLVHRDVKPGNVLLEGGDVARARLVDLGIARASAYDRELTVAGQPLGTPAYMAPEQARGRLDVDARADVFGLGAVLFRCLAGRPPFSGDTLTATLARVLFERAPRLAELVIGVPPWLDDLVDAMLSKERDARPADGAALSALLEARGRVRQPSLPPSMRSGPPPAMGSGERRVVAVVVAATPAGAAAVDEATRSMVVSGGGPDAELVQRAEAACAAHGARVDVLASGVLVATLEREGDADERSAAAARCAFALRDALGAAPVALATGLGLVDEGALLGDAIDRAVALLLARQRWEMGAPAVLPPWPKAVLVDDTTAGLLSTRFAVRPAPEGAWLSASAASETAARRSIAPFVGRSRERRLLEDELAECVRRPGARAVLILGAAGIGKSRLTREFSAGVSKSVSVWRAKSEWIGAQGSLGLVGDLLRFVFGVRPGEDPASARARLYRRMSARMASAEAERVTAFLGELLGLPSSEAGEAAVQLRAARQDPMLMADQVRRAFEDALRAESSERAVVLLLDDLQRADAASLKLIESALRALRARPLLVVGVARPELRDKHPQVLGWRGLTTLELGELSPDECRTLASVLLPRGDERAIERLVGGSAGNAFYLEELARAAARRASADATQPGAGAPDLLAPETVLTMIRSQLERASPLARRVLRAASVYGSTFSLAALPPLLGGATATPEAEVRDALEELAEADLVARTDQSFSDGGAAWAFRHDLVREAALGTLTEPDARLGHRLAGRYLAALPRPSAGAVAEHYVRGGDLRHAAEWLVTAGEHALEGNDLDGAIASSRSAIEAGAAGALAGRARRTLAEAFRWQADHVSAHREAGEALRLLDPGTLAYARAAGELATACGKLSRRDELEELTERLLGTLPNTVAEGRALDAGVAGARVVAACRAVAQLFYLGGTQAGAPALARLCALPRELLEGEPLAQARLLGAESLQALFDKRPDIYLALVRRARDAFLEAGSFRDACLFELSIGHAATELGCYQDAAAVLRGAAATARDLGLPYLTPLASLNLGLALAHLPDADSRAEAEKLERGVVAETDPARDVRVACAARTYLAIALLASGRFDEAEEQGRAAAAMTSAARPLTAAAHAVLAEALLRCGRHAEARAAAEAAAAALSASDATEEGEMHLRVVLAEALAATGDEEQARSTIARASALVLAQAARIDDPALRKSFLERVPEHRRALELASAWGAPSD
jgi:tetratricopeptide (TPR) repeat protein